MLYAYVIENAVTHVCLTLKIASFYVESSSPYNGCETNVYNNGSEWISQPIVKVSTVDPLANSKW